MHGMGEAGDQVQSHIALQRIRELLLANDKSGSLHRQLWACNNCSYLAYRSFLSALPHGAAVNPGAGRRTLDGRLDASSAPFGVRSAGDQDLAGPLGASSAVGPAAPRPAAKYAFDGVRFICDESSAPVTAVAFANVRNDWLAFGNSHGELWTIELAPDDRQSPLPHAHAHAAAAAGSQDPQQQQQQQQDSKESFAESRAVKLPKVHVRSVVAMDWSFDNSQLLTVGEDGAVCMWDTRASTCIRSLATRVPLHCCHFHKLNPNLAMVGTSTGWLEVYNCSTGALAQKLQVSGSFQWDLEVTSVEASNHHLFVGDSHGFVHLYRSEMQGGQLKQLMRQTKLQVCHSAKAPIIGLEYVAFCQATDTPLLLATCRDGSISMLKVWEKHHRIELHRWVQASAMARDVRAAICPLSTLQGLPRITMGAEDTNVYILDMSKKPHWGETPRPTVVNSLKGHRAPVSNVSFAFDESSLASADASGTVIVWKRSIMAL